MDSTDGSNRTGRTDAFENDENCSRTDTRRNSDGSTDASSNSTRRGFLAAVGAGIGAIVPMSSTGLARTRVDREACTSFATMEVGNHEFLLINNDWGYKPNRQCIQTYEDGSYGWEWTRGSTDDGDPNYPEVLLGTKPWGTVSGTSLFPLQFGDLEEMDLSLGIDNGATPPDANWDLALEWWHTTKEPDGSNVSDSITHEIMTVLEWGEGHDHGTPIEENAVTDSHGNTLDYWTQYDIGWSFHIFRVSANETPTSLDLMAIADYLTNENEHPGPGITSDLWVSGLEIGNEYWDGTRGTTTVNEFDATVNGSTATSGSSAAGTPSPTEVSTPTISPTSSVEPTATPTRTSAGRTVPPESETNAATTTATGGQPGLGIVSGLAGLSGLAGYALSGRNDESDEE